MTGATVEFCGETYPIGPGGQLVIGREGDLAIDDNPFLHRHFLRVSTQESLWWLTNLGSRLTATVADEQGMMQAWLAPGARLPLVFDRTFVWFSAGPTTYEFEILLDIPPFAPTATEPAPVGQATIGRMAFTANQKLLIVALCEQLLRRGTRGAGAVPTSAQAAERLGWALTKFNRKLDNVCQKLAKSGIRGLHGEPGKLAVNRRARLVEYALAARLVDRSDLALLDEIRAPGELAG